MVKYNKSIFLCTLCVYIFDGDFIEKNIVTSDLFFSVIRLSFLINLKILREKIRFARNKSYFLISVPAYYSQGFFSIGSMCAYMNKEKRSLLPQNAYHERDLTDKYNVSRTFLLIKIETHTYLKNA